MPRIYKQRTRKERTCGRCGTTISPGEEYRSCAPGFRGPTLTRCVSPACNFRQSELSTGKMSEAYAALEDAEDALSGDLTTAEDVADVLNNVAQQFRDVAQEYVEASDAWAGGNGNEEWQELASQLEAAADELEQWEPEDIAGAEELEEEPTEETVAAWVESASELLGNVSLP